MEFIISLVIILVDQISKFFVVKFLSLSSEIKVIDNILSFTYVENYGAAFGIFNNCKSLLVIVTVVMIVLCICVARKSNDKFLRISMSLLIGGGIGNLVDRIVYGHVVDFIRLSFFSPIFNFADVCITIGVGLFFIFMFSDREKSFLEFQR